MALYRKISEYLETWLRSSTDKILVIEGARQVGKSFIIRQVGQRLFPTFIEINLIEDDESQGIFRDVSSTEAFHLALGMVAGRELMSDGPVLIFIDEVQHYPQFLTLLKFLRQEGRYRYIASGSMLGIALARTTSIPIGSIVVKKMYQLDFEEFAIACGVSLETIDSMRGLFTEGQSLPPALHERMIGLFRRYLIVGGMPDAVQTYVTTQNIVAIRDIQQAIHQLYGIDASKYEGGAARRLHIRRIYELIPSQMESRKKRVVVKAIQGRPGDRYERYAEEFEYLVASGITNSVKAVTNPRYPLIQSAQKNLLKLYINDVGLLSMLLYGSNLTPILDDKAGINLGALYETAVAQELAAHGHTLYYYDNRHRGEVDFLIDSTEEGIVPIEVKSGRDYTIHSALSTLVANTEYGVAKAYVISNAREVNTQGAITYIPAYYTLFLKKSL